MLRHHLFALTATLWSLPIAAAPVTLTTLDGSLTLEGDLLEYDGEIYRIETAFGALSMDGGNIRCAGSGCPPAEDRIARASFTGSADMVHRLLPPLIDQFASREGYELRKVFKDDTSLFWELSDPPTGQLVAVFEGVVTDETESLETEDAVISLNRTERPTDLFQDVIALDALVPVVAPDNPRAMVTIDQLDSLLNGATKTWAPLGGAELPVSIHLPTDTVSDRMLRGFIASRHTDRVQKHDDMDALSDTVAADPAAFGIVPMSRIGNSVPMVITGSCGLSIPATANSVKAEDYPLTMPIFLHRSDARQPRVVREFIAFARSQDAQAAIRATGFIDQSIGRIGFDRQGDRLANAVLAAAENPDAMAEVQRLIGSLMDADRLTLTFRFRDGSSALDPQSASNVLRLADALGTGEFDGREIVFVGFSDSAGDPDGNLRLSERRARAVRRAVRAYAGDVPVTLSVDAFGEAMPMACDDTEWGRQVNRRVEVWVR